MIGVGTFFIALGIYLAGVLMTDWYYSKYI